MRFLIRQKMLSLKDGFTIKDESEIDQYRVKSKILSVGKKLWLLDMNENELCFIEQKLMTFMPEYHISVGGTEVMSIKQKIAFLSKKFIITGESGSYTVEGDIIAKDFCILKDGSTVMTISRKLLALADTYTVDIDDSENPVLMLAVAIVMDLVCHDPK